MASTSQALAVRLLLVLLLAGGAITALLLQQPETAAESIRIEQTPPTVADSAAVAGPQAGGLGVVDELPLRLADAADSYTGPSELSRPPAAPRILDLPRHDDWSHSAIEALIGLADAGNAQAAVMLLRRYQRCAAYENAWRRAASLQQELEQSSDTRKREALSAQLLQQGERLEADAQCKVLPPWSPTTLFDLQWRAASLGDRQAILELVVNPALDRIPPIRYRDRYDRYQTQAVGVIAIDSANRAPPGPPSCHRWMPRWCRNARRPWPTAISARRWRAMKWVTAPAAPPSAAAGSKGG